MAVKLDVCWAFDLFAIGSETNFWKWNPSPCLFIQELGVFHGIFGGLQLQSTYVGVFPGLFGPFYHGLHNLQ